PGRTDPPSGTSLARISCLRRPVRGRRRPIPPDPTTTQVGTPMTRIFGPVAAFSAGLLVSGLVLTARSDDPPAGQGNQKPHDPAAEATNVRPPQGDRPELKKTEHDKSEKFHPTKPAPSTN